MLHCIVAYPSATLRTCRIARSHAGVHTELRLKLAWVFLRREQVDAAHELVETALATCQDGASDAADRRGLNYATALALATLADVQFHRHDIDAAIVRARQAAAVASRLGQAYAEKVRLLTYLAWQLYQHDETTEACALAQRAQAALDRWMPLDARYVRSLRTTLATIHGPSHQRNERMPRVRLPAHSARVVEALAAARAMQDWLRQLIALHALAPSKTSKGTAAFTRAGELERGAIEVRSIETSAANRCTPSARTIYNWYNARMQRAIRLKLTPTVAQASTLAETSRQFTAVF